MIKYLLLILFLTLPQACWAKKKRILNLINDNISDVSSLKIPNRIRTLFLSDNNISSLEGLVLPSKIKLLSLDNNRLTSLDGLTSESLETLSIGENFVLRDLSGLSNLPNLKKLFIISNLLNENNFDSGNIPLDIEELNLAFNAFTELDLTRFSNLKELNIKAMFPFSRGFTEFLLDYSKVLLPEGLEVLLVGSRDYPDVLTELVIPDSVTEIDLSNSFITTEELKTINFPPNLKKLRIKRNSITTLEGVQFPESLRKLNLQIGPMTKEEQKRIKARFGKKIKVIFKCGNRCLVRP